MRYIKYRRERKGKSVRVSDVWSRMLLCDMYRNNIKTTRMDT